MKKMMFVVMMMTIAISANAFTYAEAKCEAGMMTDKMARELNLGREQYHAVYDINLSYLRNADRRHSDPVRCKAARKDMLKRVLTVKQYEKFLRMEYAYHPSGMHRSPVRSSVVRPVGKTAAMGPVHKDKHHRKVVRY